MEKERLTMQERKAALFSEIQIETASRCENCLCGGADCFFEDSCMTMIDFKTAILSLDDPANWPHVFEK